MKICIIGTGYVGLVTGACFAEMGNYVSCVDVDEIKINTLNSGELPIYEVGLKDVVEKNKKEGRLYFTTDIKLGMKDASFCFISVGTPPCEDGSADLSSVFEVAHVIGRCINNDVIVVMKSTAPVGTTEKIKEIIKLELNVRGKNDLLFSIASNPEFLKEGEAVKDFMQPDRVVIGADNLQTAELVKQLYQPIVANSSQVIIMDITSAELTKYAANTMLATRISFMNEIARLCDKVGGDIDHVRIGIGADSRIGNQFLNAGAGYGGSCFPKDVKELIHTGKKNDLQMDIAEAVHRVNERQKYYLVEMIKKRFGENLLGKKFATWGLAFKAQTDDIREAPSLVIVPSLIKLGAHIVAYDPEAAKQAEQAFLEYGDRIQYVDSMMDAVHNADALVVITDWPQFRTVNFNELKSKMYQRIIFDGRNQFDTEQVVENEFEYYCIGRSCYVK